jgi:hypothetical protein
MLIQRRFRYEKMMRHHILWLLQYSALFTKKSFRESEPESHRINGPTSVVEPCSAVHATTPLRYLTTC